MLSKRVRRAVNAMITPIQAMGVDHSRRHIPVAKEALDPLFGEDHWQSCWFLGSNDSLNETEFLFQNLMVEKQ